MSIRVVVIHEAQADFITATELADRLLVEQVEWLDETMLASQRQWIGEQPVAHRLTWKSMRQRAHKLGIRVHGHSEGQPGLPDARAARRAIAVARREVGDLDAILLIRDADDQYARKHGLEQARTADNSGCVIVIGVAVCERECWVITGFVAKDPRETEQLKAETQKLGWNPCHQSEELTAVKDDSALKSPKRLLAVLTNSDWRRQQECWSVTPLDTLRDRGGSNGLNDYLGEIQTHLVPLITGHGPG